jgi:hypothetical protein
MKNFKLLSIITKTIVLFLVTVLVGCKDFLVVNDKGVLTEAQISKSPEQADGLCNAAYAYFSRAGYTNVIAGWVSDIRSDDAYKGGNGPSDIAACNEFELYDPVNANNSVIASTWNNTYTAIARINSALAALKLDTERKWELTDQRIAEMRFIRSIYYLGLRLWYRYVPIIDEDVPLVLSEHQSISNRPLGTLEDDQVFFNFILADFAAAAEVLPEVQADKGRPTKWAAMAMAAKTMMFMAYEQDENNQVVNINKELLQTAIDTYINPIIAQEGTYVGLADDMADLFLPEHDNNYGITPEVLWEIQYSIDDGSSGSYGARKANLIDRLTGPIWAPGNGATKFLCCDFYKGSCNLANAFKTDENGLPLFNTYNTGDFGTDVVPGSGTGTSVANTSLFFQSHSFDPRISHSISIPETPWKYDNNFIFPFNTRSSEYGYFMGMKTSPPVNCSCILNTTPSQAFSLNKKMIRYAEVLLWKAEALIEIGTDLEGARQIINRLRTRAANLDHLKKADGVTPWLDYNIGTYPASGWTQDYARQALRWESRMELAMEGTRTYNLLRWGILKSTIDTYLEHEKQIYSRLSSGVFIDNRSEYLPIPQTAINLVNGLYKQNIGY